MGREHQRTVGRAVLHLFDEHRAHPSQALDHMAVVDDLVAHIDRRAVLGDGALDDLDGPLDSGAEPARARKQHLQGGTDQDVHFQDFQLHGNGPTPCAGLRCGGT
jgi:hypothetical protein